MNSNSYKNFIPKIFQSAEQKEKRLLERIERQRQERERAMNIALRFAALTDAVEAARENFASQCLGLEQISYSPAEFAADLLTGHRVENLAVRLCAIEKLKEYLPQIKSELQKLIVGGAENSLAAFQKEYKEVLGKLPKLERTTEPPFVPSAPVNDFEIKPLVPSRELRIATGRFDAPPKSATVQTVATPAADNNSPDAIAD